MGLGSALKKGIKKIGKGLKKVTLVGQIHKGLKKAWREVKRAWNTKIGRALIIGAAIWVGGGLLAMSYGGATGAVSGAAAFTPANVAAGYANAGSVLAGKLGMKGVASSLQTAGGAEVAAGKAALTTTAISAPSVTGVAAPTMTDAALAEAAQVQAAAGPAWAGGGGIGGGVGTFGPEVSGGGLLSSVGKFATDNPLLTYGLLQTGGNMLAAANTPTQAEEYEDILAATQRANDLSRFRSPFPAGQPTARFTTPKFGSPTPPAAPATPGLLQNPGGAY